MTAPLASRLTQPVGNVSRLTGRKVATGPDGKPLWMRRQTDKHRESR